tara:strand:- start:102 stop:668 length:567 start_codon:yes stop_codon:yes gene_type:complete
MMKVAFYYLGLFTSVTTETTIPDLPPSSHSLLPAPPSSPIPTFPSTQMSTAETTSFEVVHFTSNTYEIDYCAVLKESTLALLERSNKNSACNSSMTPNIDYDNNTKRNFIPLTNQSDFQYRNGYAAYVLEFRHAYCLFFSDGNETKLGMYKITTNTPFYKLGCRMEWEFTLEPGMVNNSSRYTQVMHT